MGLVAVGTGKDIIVASIPIRLNSITHATIVVILSVLVSCRCPVNLCQGSSAFRTVNVIAAMTLGRAVVLEIWQITAVVSGIARRLIGTATNTVGSLIVVRVVQHPFVEPRRGVILISPEIAGDARARIV
jgi:hypothetical protein